MLEAIRRDLKLLSLVWSEQDDVLAPPDLLNAWNSARQKPRGRIALTLEVASDEDSLVASI